MLAALSNLLARSVVRIWRTLDGFHSYDRIKSAMRYGREGVRKYGFRPR